MRKENKSKMEASVSTENDLKLAAEAVKTKTEADRLRVKLALWAEEQYGAWKGHWAWNVDAAAVYLNLDASYYLAFVIYCRYHIELEEHDIFHEYV